MRPRADLSSRLRIPQEGLVEGHDVTSRKAMTASFGWRGKWRSVTVTSWWSLPPQSSCRRKSHLETATGGALTTSGARQGPSTSRPALRLLQGRSDGLRGTAWPTGDADQELRLTAGQAQGVHDLASGET